MGIATDFARRARPRRGAVPLSDAGSLRRALLRTTIVRLGLACLLVALAIVAVWNAVDLRSRSVSFLPQRSTTVVVLDQSKSVYVSAYRRIDAVLRRIAAASVPVGLIVFSDTAYELMPPGTPGSELTPLLRYFAPIPGRSSTDPTTLFPTNPWTNSFSGGTKISAGLALAQDVLHRDHARGDILLLSDLGTASEDQTGLAETLLGIEHDRTVTLKIVPLFPIASDLAFFQHFVPVRDFIGPAQLKTAKAAPVRRRLLSSSPWPLLVVGGLLLLALAANELLCGRVILEPPREAAA
jgi:hypothetical protein